MTFHLAAYQEASVGAATLTALAPVIDGYLPSSETGFLMTQDMSLVAAYAIHESLSEARVEAPSLLRTAYPSIRPFDTTLFPPSDPNIQVLVSHPPRLSATESVSVKVSVGGAGQAYSLLWLCQKLERVPPGEKFTLRATLSGGTSTQPKAWTLIKTINFDQSLPSGRYAIVGFEHWCAGGIAARLLLPGYAMRPGTLSSTTVGARTADIFYDGGLGVFGTFSSFAPPLLEVLANGSTSSFEVHLTVIRIKDGAPGAAGCPDGAMERMPTPVTRS